MMEVYKGYFVSGSALSVHPFSPNWYVCGSVYVSGPGTSIVGVTRFQLQRFTVEIKELAEWFGLELARIVVHKASQAKAGNERSTPRKDQRES